MVILIYNLSMLTKAICKIEYGKKVLICQVLLETIAKYGSFASKKTKKIVKLKPDHIRIRRFVR